jgi:hypothetical protein
MMRKQFAGYYRPSEDQFASLWEGCIFCFDANVLLNIYRYTPHTRDAFLTILRRVQDRLWLPHQVAAEYHENRLEVISQQHRAYAVVRDLIEKEILGSLTALENTYARHPLIDIRALTGPMREAASAAWTALEHGQSSHPDYLTDDPLRDALADIFDDKVGQSYPDERMKKLQKEADERFERKQPPGYLDAKKNGGRKYGDVILWMQIIEHAGQQKKPIIFVTDDRKDDWWQRHAGRTIGPRPQLVQEFTDKTGVPFHMYASDQFIEHAQRFLKLADQQQAVDETRRIKERDEAVQQLHDLLVPASESQPEAAGDSEKVTVGTPASAHPPAPVVAPRPFAPSSVHSAFARPLIPPDILSGISKPLIPPGILDSLSRPLIPASLLRDTMKPSAYAEAFQSVAREIAAQSAMLRSSGIFSIARDLAGFNDILKSASGLSAVHEAARAMASERTLLEEAMRGLVSGRAEGYTQPVEKRQDEQSNTRSSDAADVAGDGSSKPSAGE